MGEQSHAKAVYLADALCTVPGVSLRYDRPFFHEFLTDLPVPAERVLSALEREGILGGLPWEGGVLWCATEVCTREELDRAADIVKEVCR